MKLLSKEKTSSITEEKILQKQQKQFPEIEPLKPLENLNSIDKSTWSNMKHYYSFMLQPSLHKGYTGKTAPYLIRFSFLNNIIYDSSPLVLIHSCVNIKFIVLLYLDISGKTICFVTSNVRYFIARNKKSSC